MMQMGYVGTVSHNRDGQYEFDQALLASPQNPVNGETTNSVNNVQMRMPIQGVSQGSLFTRSIFIGNYNSFQTSITRRMTRGFQLQASYVWSKNLDEVNGEGGTDTFELQLPTNNQNDLRHSSYGPAGDDRKQRFVANFADCSEVCVGADACAETAYGLAVLGDRRDSNGRRSERD